MPLVPIFCGIEGIYDFWSDEIEKLDDPNELILDGSLGTGKSTVAAIYLLYRLYKLFSIPNLRKHLGILEGSPIYIIYFSTSNHFSEEVRVSNFDKLRRYLQVVPRLLP